MLKRTRLTTEVPMFEPIRVALIGAGAFGVALLETLRGIRGVELVSVADRDAARAKQVAAQFQIPRATDSAQAAINAETVNTVFVATPETLHVEPVLAALEAGKDVFVEKPLAHDSASA